LNTPLVKRTLLALLIIFLCACGYYEGEPSATPYEPEPTKISTPTRKITTEPTDTPKPTATWTPIPTYSLDQAYQQITNWVDDNGGCQLPCLWGFTPGKTSLEDMDHLYATFEEMYLSEDIGIWVSRHDDRGGLSLIIYSDDTQTNIDMSYDFKGEEKLKLITVHAKAFQVIGSGSERELHYMFGSNELLEFVDEYTLSSLLRNYGEPTSILIAPYFDERPEVSGPSWIWFSIVLIYEDQGVLAEYIMPRRMIGDDFAACVDQNLEISIVTWDTSKALEFGEIANATTAFYGISEAFIDYFKPLEEATSLSIEEFTEIFKEPGTDACVYTPMEMWPNP
jgi:hypothetical protein